MYIIIDKKSGLTVGKAKTYLSARRKADKMDLAYGTINYYIKEVL